MHELASIMRIVLICTSVKEKAWKKEWYLHGDIPSMKSIYFHTIGLSVLLDCMIYIAEFIFLMMIVEHLDTSDLRSFIIIVPWKCIDQCIHFPDFWDEVGLEVTFCSGWSNKKRPVLEEKTQEIALTHSRISDIAIPDIHGILWEYPISHRERHLLISYHEPWMRPQICVIETDKNRSDEEYDYRPTPREWCEEIGDESQYQAYSKYKLCYLCEEDNPMLTCFIEDLLLETFICHRKWKDE